MNNQGKAAAAGAAAAIVSLAALIIAPFEGKVNTPYRDPVGILTVCYGHTGADVGARRRTDAECMQMLEADVKKHAKALECTDGRFNVHQGAAIVSLAYNIGVAGFCRSSASKAAKAGDYATACRKLALHVKAGGKVLPGLVTRRSFERAICEGDFDRARTIAQQKGFRALVDATAQIEAASISEAPENTASAPAEVPSSPAPMQTPAEQEKPASAPIFGFFGGCTCSAC